MNGIVAAAWPWIEALGWSLVHLLWQGILVGAAFAVLRAMVPRGRSGLRHAIGLAALAVLAACPVVTTLVIVEPAIGVDVAQATVSVAQSAGMAARGVEHVAAASSPWSFLMPWLVAGWFAGVAVMALRALRQWRELDLIVRRFAERHADVDRIFEGLRARFGAFARVRVLVSSYIDTPTLVGWLNPVVLLPTAVVLGFPRNQLELIIAHELGHLRRFDHWVNLAQVVVETLLFFHPVVHWISRDVRHSREICCDELVLRLTRGEPREYARTLAALENLRQLAPQLAVAATGGVLVDRVRRIVGLPEKRSERRRAPFAWIGATALAVFAVGLFAVSRTDDAIAAWQVERVRPALPRAVIDGPETAAPAVAWSRIELPRPPEATESAVAAESLSGTIASPSRPSPLRHDVDVAVPSVGDIEWAPAGMPAPATMASSRRSPEVLHRVDPRYPDVINARSRGHVEFEFSVDGTGNVRDITVVAGDALGAFTVAARRALREWRFEPRSIVRGERYRQDFVFVDALVTDRGADDANCARGTGSHICRAPRGVSVVTESRPMPAPAGAPPIAAASSAAFDRVN